MPENLCAENPELRLRGFYRRLNDGKLEFVSFCKPEAKSMISFTDKDFNQMLDEYLPEEDKP